MSDWRFLVMAMVWLVIAIALVVYPTVPTYVKEIRRREKRDSIPADIGCAALGSETFWDCRGGRRCPFFLSFFQIAAELIRTAVQH
jgi:hypothetical protein